MTREYTFCLLIIFMLAGAFAGWIGAKSTIKLVSKMTDLETGCEYMVNRNGGITPRIAADYMHMGCKGYEGEE